MMRRTVRSAHVPPGDAGAVSSADAPRRVASTRAHVGWIAVVVLDLAIFLTGVPLYYRLVHSPCGSGTVQGACTAGQLSASQFAALPRLRVSPDTYAAVVLAIVVGVSLVFFTVGALIAWRKWHDGMGLFVSLVLITFGATGISDCLVGGIFLVRPGLTPVLQVLLTGVVDLIVFAQWPAFGAFLLTFPTGRFTPRWSWTLIAPWILDDVAFGAQAPRLITSAIILLTIGSTLAVQVYRYRRRYGHTQRQQTKWLVFAIAAAVVGLTVSTLLQSLAAALGAPRSQPQTASLLSSATFFLPVVLAIAVALLRYRLYDIDVVINRALVYGTLTALLGAVYFGAVTGFQVISQALTAQREQPAAIVISTLVTAALFQPLRHRLQASIDRRFFRRKYDAARTVAAFGMALRNEVDLAQLTEDLLAVVSETMQPEHISLWLTQPRAERPGVDPTRPETEPEPHATPTPVVFPPLRLS